MKKINILIIEDELHLSAHLEKKLIRLDYNVVGVAADLEQAYGLFYARKPDIIIVDIMLGNRADGITFAEHVYNNPEHRKPTIFLTGKTDKATFEKAKLAHPAAYFIKPFNIHELQYNIDLAIVEFQNEQSKAQETDADYLFVKKGDNYVMVYHADIQYIMVDGKYSDIHTPTGKYVVKQSLANIQRRMPASFLRVHNNYLINLRQIERFNKKDSQLFLKGNTPIPVSQGRGTVLLEQLNSLK